MNYRQTSLLKLLIQTDHFKLIREYCQLLNCSDKTLRTDIKTINSFLKTHNFKTTVAARQGRGIKIQLLAQEKEYLSYLLGAELLEVLPNLERFYKGVITLLFSDEENTIDSLAEALYINSAQIKEDLRRWDNMLYTFHLELVKKQHLAISGREEDIRLFVLYYFYLLAPEAMTGKIEPLIIGEHRQLFRKVLSMMEKEQSLCFTSHALHQLESYLAILVKRIQLGCVIPVTGAVPTAPYMEIKRILEERLAIDVSSGELCFLQKMAESAGKKWSDQIFSKCSLSSQSTAMTGAFLLAIEARCARPVPAHLKLPLALLMETALRRRRNGMLVLNHEGNRIKAEYLREYLIVTRIFFDTALLRKWRLNDMEYSRFTMLLLPYFNEIRLIQKYRAGLIVNCSLEQAYFGKYKIERSLPRISVRQILTEEEIEEYEDGLDFFITFNYTACAIPHIEISSMVNQNDIAELSAFLDHYMIEETKHMKFNFPCRRNTLKTAFLPNIAKLLYRDMKAEGAAQLTYEEYEQRLIMQKVIKNDKMLVIFYDSSVKKQLFFIYRAENKTYIDGLLIQWIYILYIKDDDDAQLTQIIQKLRIHEQN